MISDWFSEKADKYAVGGDVAEYTAGRDITVVAMMFFDPSGGIGKLLNKVLGKLKNVGSVITDKMNGTLKKVILRTKKGIGPKLKRDLDTNPKLKKLFDESSDPEGLAGAWKKMDELGADEALRKNPGAVEALSKPKFERPDPSTYLDADYIAKHLSKFDEGVTKFVSDAPTGAVGPPSGTFVMPKSQADDIIRQAGGDVNKLEKLLGLEKGTLGANPVRLDVENPSGIRMPSGNELGANDNWIPGGKTSGGILEATADQIQPGTYQVKPAF